MKFSLGALALGVCVTAEAGTPVEVNVLNSQYNAYVFGETNFSGGTYSAVGDIVIYPADEISRTTVSPTPFSDSIFVDSTGSLVAQASATTFGLNTYTDSPKLYTITGWPNNWASAGAESEISFSPLTSGTTTIGLQFFGSDNWYNSQGFVSLFDGTANQTLWNYNWYLGHFLTPETIHDPLEGGVGGNVPWVSTDDGEIAMLTLDTDFNAADTYTLTMYSQAFSNNENEGTSIQLSGIEIVPEPSVFALVSLGAATWLTLYRRGHASARSVRRTTILRA